jgi:hypothetical protein
LVASETREGDVYQKLLAKLEVQRAALGGRVFDVLGRLFDMGQADSGTGRSRTLRELLIDAVRYGDQPEVRARLDAAIDNATDREHIRALIEHDALARDSLDARKVQTIREEVERAEAKRLQPHYIQAFFMDAFRRLGGTISERERGRYEIGRVPGLLRERDRQIGHGPPVLLRYERVTFEKDLINVPGKPTAAFICPGHPLLDAVLDVILEQNASLLRRGAILIDPHERTKAPRALFYLEHSIRDAVRPEGGEPRPISREIEFVEIPESGPPISPGYAPYLDYRPATEAELGVLETRLKGNDAWLHQGLEQRALNHAVESLVPQHVARVRADREARIDKTIRAVKARLTAEIQYWDHRANQLRDREQAGQTPKINSTMARERADDLEGRLQRRLARLEQERHISPVPPLVMGGALVIPASFVREESAESQTPSTDNRDEIDRLAIQAVLAAERALGRIPKEMDHSNPGFDIESSDPSEPGRLRCIEVKGKSLGRDTVTVSATQIRTCLNKGEDWILAIVQVDGSQARPPRYVRRPFSVAPDFAEVSKNLDMRQLMEMSKEPS